MRSLLLAAMLCACAESGGGRSDVDAPPITEAGPREGGIPDRLLDEPPPCVLPDPLATDGGFVPVDAPPFDAQID